MKMKKTSRKFSSKKIKPKQEKTEKKIYGLKPSSKTLINSKIDWDFIKKLALGKGTFGTVWLAKNINTKKYFALKEINKAMTNKNSLSFIKEEVKILKKLKHDFMVNL